MATEQLLMQLKIPETVLNQPLHSVTFRFSSVVLELKSNSEKICSMLSAYHRDFLCEDPTLPVNHTVYYFQEPNFDSGYSLKDFSRQGKIKEAFIDIFEGRLVRKKKYGIEIYFDGHNHVMIGDLENNLHQMVLFLNVVFGRTFLARSGYLLLNAMAIARNNQVYILAGGASPSVLFALLDNGFSFCAMDRVMVRAASDRVHVIGYPSHPRLHPGAILAHPKISLSFNQEDLFDYQAMSAAKLWAQDTVLDVDIHAVYNENRFQLEGNLHGLFLLEWEPESSFPTRSESLSVEGLLGHLPTYYKDLGVFDLNNTRGERRITPDLDHLSRIFRPIMRTRLRGRLDIQKLISEIDSQMQ